jgi:hypothetical protein
MSLASKAQLVPDTIIIIAGYETSFFPWRGCMTANSKGGPDPPPYIDSIRVCSQQVNKGWQRYYLIVKDKSGKKRLEGEFFDEFADGKVIIYDRTGKKTEERHYKVSAYNKPRTICRKDGKRLKKNYYSRSAGTWRYYDRSGKVIKEEKH